ncbi:MAG: sulfotransferase [Planctomycetota bacterium]
MHFAYFYEPTVSTRAAAVVAAAAAATNLGDDRQWLPEWTEPSGTVVRKAGTYISYERPSAEFAFPFAEKCVGEFGESQYTTMPPIQTPKLLLVMGMHRSGASVLFDSLALDPSVEAHSEGNNSPLFELWWLRPEPVWRSVIVHRSRQLLIKALSEVQVRSVESVLREYQDYSLDLVWIYRNPGDVWASNVRLLRLSDQHMQAWLEMWIRSHQSLLDAMDGEFGSRVTLVRYEDLCQAPEPVFRKLCARLKIEASHSLFQPGTRDGGKGLSKTTTQLIEAGASDLLRQLDQRRSIVPPMPPDTKGSASSHQ